MSRYIFLKKGRFKNNRYLKKIMKIIKAPSKSVINKKGKKVEYNKFLINVPKKIVEESGFLDKSLKAELKNMKIIISLEN